MRIDVNKHWQVYFDFGRASSLSLQLIYCTYHRLLHMCVTMKNHALPVYKKNRIASLLCIFEIIIVKLHPVHQYILFNVYCLHKPVFWDYWVLPKKGEWITVLPAKSDSDVMFCLQSYQGLIIDISQAIYRFALAQVECTS